MTHPYTTRVFSAIDKLRELCDERDLDWNDVSHWAKQLFQRTNFNTAEAFEETAAAVRTGHVPSQQWLDSYLVEKS